MMIYTNCIDEISTDMLKGFFVGWPNPPSPETHLKLLKKSSNVVIAVDADPNQAVGFITAISDGVLSAYIPLLEVLPAHKSKGIGQELVRRMLKELDDMYMIDLCCDDDIVSFYKQFGLMKTNGMLIRNYKTQAGISECEKYGIKGARRAPQFSKR